MADEELAIASPALETPASEEPTVETPEVEEEIPDPVDEGDDAEDEVDELDFGFKKYQVPKSLKQAVEDLRADATRKQQDASSRQKALEAREAQIEERLKVTDAELDDRATLKAIDKQLSDYAKLTAADWETHLQSDPSATQRAQLHWQMLKDQRNEVNARLEKAGKERTEAAQSELTKRIQETLEHAKKSTIGLKPEAIPKLVAFAQEIGIPDETIQRNWSPKFADILHYARIGKLASEKQKSAGKTAAPATPPQPVTPVAAKGTAPKLGLRDDLSPEEWVRRRNAQLKKRA